MNYYPVLLDLRGRPCLVIGTGRMASHRAAALRKAGARVRRQPVFEEAQAGDCWLIIAVTRSRTEAQRLHDYAEKRKVFLNIVDDADSCSLISPAVVEQEDLLIAVSTSGKCPALASRIRQELEARYGPEYAELVRALGELRPEVKKRFRSMDERRVFYHKVFDTDLIQTLRDFGSAGLKTALYQALEEQTHGIESR
ncbi:MAG: bifunctional precorrin-2 dehydrogenase/sirohydrochlorin ferrochelatase [Acidobacteriota bacterium]